MRSPCYHSDANGDAPKETTTLAGLPCRTLTLQQHGLSPVSTPMMTPETVTPIEGHGDDVRQKLIQSPSEKMLAWTHPYFEFLNGFPCGLRLRA
jgi:hypothetical protein